MLSLLQIKLTVTTMRLNYHAYYFQNMQTGRKVQLDIRPFLRAFSSLQSPEVRSCVEYNGETLYLMHDVEDTFLLVQTRMNEIIRKIDTQNLTVDEITALLNDHEQVGFASYLHFGEGFFGIATTVLAPRIGAVDALISTLFNMLNINEWRFITHPLVHDISADSVKDLDFVSGTSIELAADLSIGEDLMGMLGFDQDEFQLFDGFEIKIKPRRNRNIKEPISRFAEDKLDQGVGKMVMRAKREAGDLMTDLYLNESGSVFDTINKGNGHGIAAKISDKVENNDLVREKVAEIREINELDTQPIDAICRYNSVDNWPNNLVDL